MSPTLYIVATPIGNLNDMSLRAVDILKGVKYIACEDTRTTMPLLKRYQIDSGKVFGCHKFNEDRIRQDIIDKMLAQQCDIALVSDAGTPCISDPGALLVSCARQNGIKVIGIPGACTVPLAMSISGFDSMEWAFLGFYPKDNKQARIFVDKLKYGAIDCFVFFESPFRILDTLTHLSKELPQATCMVGKELTKMFEYSTTGLLDDVIASLQSNTHANKGEFVIVIRPNFVDVTESIDIAIEALLVDEIVKNQVTLKQAVQNLSKKTKHSKNQIYEASLSLKFIVKTEN